LIDSLAGNKALPKTIRQDIIERTDGIPLFVEEMTKAVLEAKSEDEAHQTAAAVPSSSVAVPASLYASLMARLDRLGPAKELAQIGAAIAREFSHALIAAVARKPEAEFQSTLDRLVVAGLLFRQGVPPMPRICSSTRLCRMRRMGPCCVSKDARCTRASPTPLRVSSLTSPRANLNLWRVTAPKLA
jgi:predicted ATPase